MRVFRRSRPGPRFWDHTFPRAGLAPVSKNARKMCEIFPGLDSRFSRPVLGLPDLLSVSVSQIGQKSSWRYGIFTNSTERPDESPARSRHSDHTSRLTSLAPVPGSYLRPKIAPLAPANRSDLGADAPLRPPRQDQTSQVVFGGPASMHQTIRLSSDIRSRTRFSRSTSSSTCCRREGNYGTGPGSIVPGCCNILDVAPNQQST